MPPSPFAEAAGPINLAQNVGALPPTVAGVASGGGMFEGANPRGLNRTGKVNTNISLNKKSSEESNILNRTYNTQM
jgi:hypothetical protein